RYSPCAPTHSRLLETPSCSICSDVWTISLIKFFDVAIAYQDKRCRTSSPLTASPTPSAPPRLRRSSPGGSSAGVGTGFTIRAPSGRNLGPKAPKRAIFHWTYCPARAFMLTVITNRKTEHEERYEDRQQER